MQMLQQILNQGSTNIRNGQASNGQPPNGRPPNGRPPNGRPPNGRPLCHYASIICRPRPPSYGQPRNGMGNFFNIIRQMIQLFFGDKSFGGGIINKSTGQTATCHEVKSFVESEYKKFQQNP